MADNTPFMPEEEPPDFSEITNMIRGLPQYVPPPAIRKQVLERGMAQLPPDRRRREPVPVFSTLVAWGCGMVGAVWAGIRAVLELGADAFASAVRSAQAPPGFAARVRRVAVPVLATGLVLSLSFNVWQGFRGESPPVERSIAPTQEVSTLQAALVRGQRLAREKQYPSAVSAYQNALQEVLRPLMVESATAYKDEQTIDAATALLMLTPNDAEPYRYRGLAYVRTGNKGQALQDMRRAAELGDAEAQRILQTW